MNKVIILVLFIYIFCYCFLSNKDYFDCSKIIKKQIKSIINKKEERRIADLYAFIKIYIIPLIFSIFMSLEDVLSQNFYDNIILILAILVSVFLTLITILTSKSYKDKKVKQKKVIEYTFINIYFLTIISLILLVMCFCKICVPNLYDNIIIIPIFSKILTKKLCKNIFNTIVIYFVIEIFIHILIVLKRIGQFFLITFED